MSEAEARSEQQSRPTITEYLAADKARQQRREELFTKIDEIVVSARELGVEGIVAYKFWQHSTVLMSEDQQQGPWKSAENQVEATWQEAAQLLQSNSEEKK